LPAADEPPDVELFDNRGTPSARRAFENLIRGHMGFTRIDRLEERHTGTRAHIMLAHQFTESAAQAA
jgi:hypothetical protein